MKNNNRKFASTILCGLVAMCTGGAFGQSIPDPHGDICFIGKVDRWNDNGSEIYIDMIFQSVNPSGIEFDGQFFIGYTGEAPVQTINPPHDLSFTFSPGSTTVSLDGFVVPDTLNGLIKDGEKYELCHVCYDFRVSIIDNPNDYQIVVSSEDSKDPLISVEGMYVGGGSPITFNYFDKNGDPVKDLDFKVQVDLSNFEVCYCVIPEPSSALLGALSIGLLVVRRKR